MLVTVNEECRLVLLDVAHECDESSVNLIVLVMDLKRRVVGDKYVNSWEGNKRSLDFRLLE